MSIKVDNSIELSIKNVSKSFNTATKNVKALDKVSLNIRRGEFISLVGPSGCGKTTLLRLISGLETDYEGEILLENVPIKKPGFNRGMVFQEARLLPWLTVGENVGFGLQGKKSYKRERVHYYLEKVGLEDFEKAYPSQLSGGMQQKVAIARVLICQPKVLLLDEPFGALDAFTRVYLQEEIERIWFVEKTTMILVTHDIEEAIFLGDRVVVMTARPAEIKLVVDINLKRSRDRNDAEFVSMRRNILRTFHDAAGTYSI
jgi:sulfonate transport system ATP-binding protein